MPAGRLEARDRALGRAHTRSHGFLRQARTGASGEHFVRNRNVPSFRIGGRSITDHSAVRDDLGMLQQLGLIAPQAV
jgi:hypothetical protein